MQPFTHLFKLFFVLFFTGIVLFSSSCIQIEISDLPAERYQTGHDRMEHYLIVQPPTEGHQLLDCTAADEIAPNSDTMANATNLDCHPIALTIHP